MQCSIIDDATGKNAFDTSSRNVIRFWHSLNSDCPGKKRIQNVLDITVSIYINVQRFYSSVAQHWHGVVNTLTSQFVQVVYCGTPAFNSNKLPLAATRPLSLPSADRVSLDGIPMKSGLHTFILLCY